MQAKKIGDINSLIKKKNLDVDKNHLVKEIKQINVEWDNVWENVRSRGARSADKEKLNSIKKRASDLKLKFEQKAKFAETKKDAVTQSQYEKMLAIIEKEVMRRLR